jgi:hypothetical protein
MPNGLLVLAGIFLIAFVLSHGIAVLSCTSSGNRVGIWVVIGSGCTVIAAALAGIGAPQHAGTPAIYRATWAAFVMLVSWPITLAGMAACSVAAYYLFARTVGGEGRRVTVAISVGSSFALDVLFVLSQFGEMH